MDLPEPGMPMRATTTVLIYLIFRARDRLAEMETTTSGSGRLLLVLLLLLQVRHSADH